MAGKNAGFNAQKFRKNIRFVMEMGAPPADGERAIFYMPSTLVYNRGVDESDLPFDPNSTVVRQPSPPIVVSCAVEFRDVDDLPTDFGDIVPAKAVITVLDEDYARIKGCEYVTLRGERYKYHHVEAPLGLFDVGIYTLHFRAVDQT